MQMLLSTQDNLLFAIDALAYNILNIITKNSLIYGFIILYVKSQRSQSNMILILSFAATILMNLLFTHLYIPLIYKKHKNYIISKVSVYIRDMYMHALIDKYLTQKSMKNIYEIFNSFTQYIDNYWSLYEMHAEIIVASIIIAIAYNSNSVNKIILIISSAILIILFILDNVLLDKFNDLHEYFITSILNEKLLLIFLIYVPYAFVNNKNINPNILLKKSTNNIYGSLMAIFIILFWKISFNNFLNKYSNKIDLTHKIKEFIIAEQQQALPTEINELSNKHNHFIYLIHDSNEPISIIDYFRLTNPNISKSKIIKTLDKLSILPELQKKLNTKMNDTSLTDEQKIKISVARSLIIPENYTVIYFQDDQIVNKYLKIISNHKIPITGNPHAS
jgi:hypothetical protein